MSESIIKLSKKLKSTALEVKSLYDELKVLVENGEVPITEALDIYCQIVGFTSSLYEFNETINKGGKE